MLAIASIAPTAQAAAALMLAALRTRPALSRRCAPCFSHPAFVDTSRTDDAVPAAPHFAVVLAGGSGTRFWPRSRAAVPKQLLALAGKQSLLQDAAQRMASLVGWRRVLVVTGTRHVPAVRRQLPRVAKAQVLAEP